MARLRRRPRRSRAERWWIRWRCLRILRSGIQQQEEAEFTFSPEFKQDFQKFLYIVKKSGMELTTASGDEQHEKIELRWMGNEALQQLQPLRTRSYELESRRHDITSDLELRLLAFLDSEMSFILSFLVTRLRSRPSDIDFLGTLDAVVRDILKEVDLQRHTLLRRASRCFTRWSSESVLAVIQICYCLGEETIKHHVYLGKSSSRGQPLREAEPATGLPLFGMDRSTKKLLWWLTSPEKGLRVMAIVGPPGIGKTTLAMELRNRLTGYFHYSVMAKVVTDNTVELLQDILSQISDPAAPAAPFETGLKSLPEMHFTMSVERLVRVIYKRLENTRYFVVIDDIWYHQCWHTIKGAFPSYGIPGSWVLITTRFPDIARSCHTGSGNVLVHEMNPLNQIDSERLLLAKAFDSVDGWLVLDRDLKLFCNSILTRCQGIPFLIIFMAEWLKEQLQQQQQDVEHGRTPMVYSEEQVPQLPKCFKDALSFTYFQSLMSNKEVLLQSLYLSMFPYGCKFEKGRLLDKWLHEGISGLQWEPSEIMSFIKLVDKNIVTCTPTDRGFGDQDEDEACVWHVQQGMHQFLISKSAEVGFVFTSTTIKLASSSSSSASATDHGGSRTSRVPRRLALHHPDPDLPSLLQTMDLSQTRSLAVSGAVSGIIPLEKFVNLVVLDLQGWENLKDDDIKKICRSKMFFLTYLSINSTAVTKLPPEIKELYSLMLLDISQTQISELPLEVFKLKFLEQLYLTGTRIRELPDRIVARSSLQSLVGGEGMIDPTGTATRLPKGISRLHQLRTLSTVDLSEQPASFVEELGRLEWLKVLAITWSLHQCTDGTYREALLSSIQKWQCLESLTIHCGLGCSMEFLAGSLSHPPSQLNKFKVTSGRFPSIPQWIGWLTRLSFVQITIFRVETSDLKKLRSLPKLQCLILGLDFIPGGPIVIENVGFRELQRFSVDCPVPWLTFKTGAMPKLTYLQLKLYATPSRLDWVATSGISNLRRLTEVALCCHEHYVNSPSVKMTVEAVRNEIAKHEDLAIDLFMNGVRQDVEATPPPMRTASATATQSGTSNAGAGDDAQAQVKEAAPTVKSEIIEEDGI